MKKTFFSIGAIIVIGLLFFIVYLYGPWWFQKVKPYDLSNGSVGLIDLPEGYERVNDATGFADYLRGLPLAANGVQVKRITGELADSLHPYSYRVIDVPLLHHYEQCADVCIRLRAEYLFLTRQFWKIHFEDTQYNTMRYYWGGLRRGFISYLVHVYEFANTESLIHEMPQRPLSDMQPGDVFIYCNKDRGDKQYGHAIMVADVARHRSTGRKIFLLLQGSTPACSIHILKNRNDSVLSPWFELDEKASMLNLGTAVYLSTELRYFEDCTVFSCWKKRNE